MNLKEELISCSDGTCTCVDHYDLIECFHKSIIDICIFSANQSIPFSKPIRKQRSNTIPNWNSAVAPFSDRCRRNPKVPSSIPAGGKDFP